MTLRVSEIELDARDQHPLFTEHSTPPKVLRRQLARKAQALLERAVAIHPGPFMTCVYELELPLADFEHGEPLPDFVYIEGGRVEPTGDSLHLVSHRVLATPPYWPAASIVAGRLYLGRTEADWSGAEKATVLYVPPIEDAVVTDAGDEPDAFDPLPEYARDALVAEAALLLARRAEGVSAEGFYQDRKEAVTTFLKTIAGQKRATTGKMAPMPIRG